MARLAGLVGEQVPRFEVVEGGAVGAAVADVGRAHQPLVVEGQRLRETLGIPLEKQRPIQADVKGRGCGLPGQPVMGGAGMLDEV